MMSACLEHRTPTDACGCRPCYKARCAVCGQTWTWNPIVITPRYAVEGEILCSETCEQAFDLDAELILREAL